MDQINICCCFFFDLLTVISSIFENKKMEKINDFIKLKSYKVFIFNCLLYFVALFLEFRYIFTNEFYAQNLNHYTEKQVFDFILLERNAEWANYVFAIGLVLMSSLVSVVS